MKNKKLLRFLITGIIILFSAGWLLLYRAFFINNYDGLLLPVIFFIFAFLSFYFLIILEHDSRILYIVCSFGMLGAVFLGKDYLIGAFLVWVLVTAGCVVAIGRIKTEQDNRINIDIYRVLKRGAPIIGTVFTLLVSVGFYFSIANLQKVGKVPRFNVDLPIETTRTAFTTMNIIMPNEEVSWIVDGVTVDEYFRKIIRSQDVSLRGTVLEEIQNEVNDETRAQLEAGMEREMWEKERALIEKNRETLEGKLQVELDGNERIDEVLHNLINKRANELINGEMISSDILPIGAALALFVSVRSIVWIANVVLFWTVSGIFSILVRLGKIKIIKEKKEVETIEV